MKKIISFLIMIALVISFAACEKETRNEETGSTNLQNTINSISEEEKSSFDKDNIGGNDIPLCNHIYEYHSIDKFYIDYVEERAPGWMDKFADLFIKTEDFNLRFFADYFGISKDIMSEILTPELIDFKKEHNIWSEADNIDLWYTDGYMNNRKFFADDNPAPDSGSVMIRPQNDTIHTDRYFTIHKTLIELVGEDSFDEFKQKYGGTEDFNILNFIDYFDISRESFEACMEEQRKTSSYIYNVDYVYGTEEQQKMYFEKHIIEVKE